MCTENARNKTKNVVYPEVPPDTRSTMPKFTINSVFPVNLDPHPPVVALTSKTDPPHLLAETKIVDLDGDIDSESDYDGYESSLNNMVGANPRHVLRELKERIKSSFACDESTIYHHASVSEFEDSYGTIPDRIFCSSISVTKSKLVSVRRPKAWVFDSTISAFMMLINQEGVITFDTSFVTFFHDFLNHRAVEIYADFLRRFFGRRFDEVWTRLKNSRALLIPLFNVDALGENGNHCGLAVLQKP